MSENQANNTIHPVIIIGSGPAAHTCAIYVARAGLKPILFEGFMAAGTAAGGQLTTTTEIENFPGFPAGISGLDLMDNMRAQSLRFGTQIITETVTKVDLKNKPFSLTSDSGTYLCRALIIATGASANRLHIEGEEKLWQNGISACAVCDGALPLFSQQDLALVGGGDTACEEALFLTKFATKVYMLVRKSELRASQIMKERVLHHEKIEILWNTEVLKATGANTLESIEIIHNLSKEKSLLPVKGLFYAVGHTPNIDFLDGQLHLDKGYIQTDTHLQTSIEGVYACGDVQDHRYRQAITAAGSGCMAALEAIQWLDQQK